MYCDLWAGSWRIRIQAIGDKRLKKVRVCDRNLPVSESFKWETDNDENAEATGNGTTRRGLGRGKLVFDIIVLTTAIHIA